MASTYSTWHVQTTQHGEDTSTNVTSLEPWLKEDGVWYFYRSNAANDELMLMVPASQVLYIKKVKP